MPFQLLKFCSTIILTNLFTVVQVNSNLQSHSQIILFNSIVGGSVQLPCNTTASEDDMVQLILWYKTANGTGPPFLTVDGRNVASIALAKPFVAESWNDRTRFNLSVQPSMLFIDPVTENDAGEYSCRIDYKWARTSITTVRVNVVVPPNDITIMDKTSRQRLNKIAGPYEEGSNLTLKCEAHGGKPPPRLSWFRDNQMIDDLYHVDHISGNSVNELIIVGISRDYLESVFTCQANVDANPTPPSISASIRIDLNFKPTHVSIISPRQSLRVGKKVNLICQTKGSKPPARISWTLNGRHLTDFNWTDSPDGRITTSVLNYVPSPDDHDVPLICSATNPRQMSNISFSEAMHDIWHLDIHFRPRLTLTIDTLSNESFGVEGKETSLECNIKANPNVSEIHWLLNGKPIVTNSSAKDTKLTDNSLILMPTRRDQEGEYQCVAKNAEGTARSNFLKLKIYYSPVCSIQQKSIYEVALGEIVHIDCIVEAMPTINMSFSWRFINVMGHSREVVDFNASSTSSRISTIITSPEEYGSYVCYSSNIIGQNRMPCEFVLLPKLEVPKALEDCHLTTNQTNEAHIIYIVECEDSYSSNKMRRNSSRSNQLTFGTKYNLEVYDSKRSQLIFHLDGQPKPTFAIFGLKSTENYIFVIYSQNEVGKSRERILTTTPAESQVLQSFDQYSYLSVSDMSLQLIIGAAIGGLSVLFAMITLIKLLTLCKKPRRSVTQSSKVADDSCEEKQSITSITLKRKDTKKTLNRNYDELRSDQTNPKTPDVVPLNQMEVIELNHLIGQQHDNMRTKFDETSCNLIATVRSSDKLEQLDSFLTSDDDILFSSQLQYDEYMTISEHDRNEVTCSFPVELVPVVLETRDGRRRLVEASHFDGNTTYFIDERTYSVSTPV